jgi:FkbM family methyltransferase
MARPFISDNQLVQMKINKKNYLALSVLDLVLISLGRLVTSVTSGLKKAVIRGIEMDAFIRHANLHGCNLKRDGKFVTISAPEAVFGRPHTMRLRLGSSDFAVYGSGVFCHDYVGIDELVRGQEDSVRFIVDAGANIGSTSLRLSIKFPNAQIIGIEADAANFKVFQTNMEFNHCINVDCHHAALWGKREKLSVSSEGREWGHQVRAKIENIESGTAGVSTLTMDDLVGLSPNGIIDILKMDIEGAEESVFSVLNEGCSDWLSSVRFIALEIHGTVLDSMIKGILRSRDFFVFQTGETTYAKNLNLV